MTRILLIIYFIIYSIEVYSQFNWQKIPLQSLSEIEDIAISRSKYIYVAVKGREIILLSKDRGETWQDIIIDKELGKYINQSKDLYIDHQDSLYIFYQDGSTYLRKWDGVSAWRWADTQLQDLVLITFDKPSTNLKYNSKGEYFISEGQTLFKYSKLWSQKVKLLDLPESIVDYYLDVDNNAYCITYDYFTLKYYSINFNLKTYQYLGDFRAGNLYTNLTNGKYRTVITDSSNYFLASEEGLFASFNRSKSWQKVNIPNNNVKFEFIYYDRILKYLYAKTATQTFFSADNGNSWTEINHLNSKFKSNFLTRIEIIDSTTAFETTSEFCPINNENSFIKKSDTAWSLMQVKDPNAYLFNFIQPNHNLIIAKSVYSCDYVRSDNNGITWTPLKIEDYYPNRIIKVHENLYLLFLINYDKQLIKYQLTDSNFLEFKETKIGNIRRQLKNYYICNNEYINVYLYANRNDTPYVEIYQSPIKNITWKYVSTIINDDIDDAKISCIGSTPYYYAAGSPPLFLRSNDQGISWVKDPLLDDFQSVNFMNFGSSEKIFITGRHKVDGLNLFVTDGVESPKPVSDFWKDNYLGLNTDHYPFLIGLNNEKGLFISHDAGINWLNITGNLPFQYQNKEA
ncbi:MAG: hypothetical protein HOP11_11970, partial [Saprospiraceae bacterium]|nr:hypothetical protein [Saprospiraceae bacterium]